MVRGGLRLCFTVAGFAGRRLSQPPQVAQKEPREEREMGRERDEWVGIGRIRQPLELRGGRSGGEGPAARWVGGGIRGD